MNLYIIRALKLYLLCYFQTFQQFYIDFRVDARNLHYNKIRVTNTNLQLMRKTREGLIVIKKLLSFRSDEAASVAVFTI